MDLSNYYQLTNTSLWQGRSDDLRVYQRVIPLDLLELLEQQQNKPQLSNASKNLVENIEAVLNGDKFTILGFACDEGVRRNQGRIGAVDGPAAIRKALAGLALHRELIIYDAGDICYQALEQGTHNQILRSSKTKADDSLDLAQIALGNSLTTLINNGYKPLLLGGGHEIAYGHFLGLYNSDLVRNHNHSGSQLPAKIGIINFDAHFDLRPLENNQGSSGTAFLQIANLLEGQNQKINYMCLGVQESSNTQSLYETANKLGVQYLSAQHLNDSFSSESKQNQIHSQIKSFIATNDYIYLTICLDVFDAAFAPGVSAVAVNGLLPQVFMPYYRTILNSQKVISMDIAEMSPRYDIDGHTAKLAAKILHHALLG